MINAPKNLEIVNSLKFSEIAHWIQLHAKAAHFTNGTYAMKPEIMVPTTLAGFKEVTKTSQNLPLVIAINSDISMKALEKEGFEDENTRALNVAIPLAQAFPHNKVVIAFYNEKTPTALYQALAQKNLTRTLHKWGYGTADNEPKIEGAESFELVYGFPLPNDTKPICYHDTDVAKTKQDKVIVKDLRNKLISHEGVLFDLPESLKQYQAQVNKPSFKKT